MNLLKRFLLMDEPAAERALYDLMRQGIIAGACIPEIETEAEQVAHHMLGCDNYMALLAVYTTADDLRAEEPATAAIITDLADSHLRDLTHAVIHMRGPIGAHKCRESTGR